MVTRRQCLKFACLSLCLPLQTVFGAAPDAKEKWSTKAFAAAASAREALIRHPFLTDAFAGTLEKSVFVEYLCQNILYLEHYARCLDRLGKCLAKMPSFEDDANNLAVWAEETVALRSWTIEYVSALTGKAVDATGITALPELLTYRNFEVRYVNQPEPAIAMAALLPCFWAWDEFGRALRPKAHLQGNPFKNWVEGMGSDAASVSARKAVDLADRLSLKLGTADRQLMTDVFVAGSWMEWQLFDAVMQKRVSG